MIMKILLVQQLFIIKIQAMEICYYRNQSVIVAISCKDDCCTGMSTSPESACCAGIVWTIIAIPFFAITGVCLLVVCLVYIRPFFKLCLCGCKCPYISRPRVSSPGHVPSNTNPVYIMNNDDLPDYETIIKDSRVKDITPPPYNFVAAHPTDFGFEANVSNAPPQYRSRCSSLSTVGPNLPGES